MSLYTARLLVPVTRRQDYRQDHLPWFPTWVYSDFRSQVSRNWTRCLGSNT